MNNIQKIIVIGLLLSAYCFAFQGQRGLFDPDEGRYSAVALQMLKSGDWLVPRTHPEQEHWAKPPLAYWAIAASLKLFGHNEFAVRFPNALSFLGCILIAYFLGQVFTPQRPWAVALVFATFLFPATVCNGATTDYLMTLWQVLAVCFFACAYWLAGGGRRPQAVWLMWVSFGLGFLTKGPPALLPLMSIMIFLKMEQGVQKDFRMYWGRGVLLLVLIGGSWPLAAAAGNPGLMRYFVWDELILRIFSGHHGRHSEWFSFLYIYFPALILGSLPWSYWTGRGLVASFTGARRAWKHQGGEGERQSLFLMLWFFVPLSVFMVSRSNLPLYVLPLFIPLAIVTARAAEENRFSFSKFRIMIGVWCAVIVLIRPVMASIPFRRDASAFARELSQRYPGRIGECVFANVRPALGLQFYTGADVKSVILDPTEIQGRYRGPGTRLWFVPPEYARELSALSTDANIPLKNLGTMRERDDYAVFLEGDNGI